MKNLTNPESVWHVCGSLHVTARCSHVSLLIQAYVRLISEINETKCDVQITRYFGSIILIDEVYLTLYK